MKTISLSALILIASPFCVVAQDAPQTVDYYVQHSVGADANANHIVSSQINSSRKSSQRSVAPKVPPVAKVPAIQPVAKPQPVQEFDVEIPKVAALNYLLKRDELIPGSIEEVGPTIQQTTKLQQSSGGSDFKPMVQKSQGNFQMASRRRFKEVLVRAQQEPTQDFPGVDQIVRPSPGNTIQIEPVQNDVEIVSPPVDYDMISEPETLQPQANQLEVFQQQTVQPEAVQAEAASLDHIGMSQRRNSWDERPDTMRDTVDHFSPGGEPFAVRGLGGNPTFFGIDRRTCCDEWAGFCNCSGGLKVNPGHLGIPWLRSKGNCDSATGCGANLGRNARSGCGCASCNGR